MENIAGESCDRELSPHLTGEARRYWQAWGDHGETRAAPERGSVVGRLRRRHSRRDELLRILAIGHDTSMRGEGISLRDAIQRSRYRELRKQFLASDLVSLIQEHGELVTQWTMYSEDKRTSGGFALSGASPEVVADYVVRELDFWALIK